MRLSSSVPQKSRPIAGLSRAEMAFRGASAAMALLFAVAIAVQWNDPDPLVWMAVYAIPCGFSLAACAGRRHSQACAVLGLAYLVSAAAYLPVFADARSEAYTHWHMQSAGDEEAREGAGLVLSAVWLAILASRFGKSASVD
jgi:hypothetical protein